MASNILQWDLPSFVSGCRKRPHRIERRASKLRHILTRERRLSNPLCCTPQSSSNPSRRRSTRGPLYVQSSGRGDWLLESGKIRGQQEARGVPALYLKRPVRQYEEIVHDGPVIVFGDVCAGAVVRASGDIIVLGRLAGKAHAGAAIPPSSLSPPGSSSSSSSSSNASGRGLQFNRQSVVVALEMQPSVIAVASEVVAGPGGGEEREHHTGQTQQGQAQMHRQPEVARIADNGGICIEPLRPPAARPFVPSSDPLSSLLSSQLTSSNLTWQTEDSSVPPFLSPLSWLRLVRPGSPAAAAVATGTYIAAAGAAALIAPKTTFGLLFPPGTLSSGWIRVLATLATVFGLYYLGAARGDVMGQGTTGFYEATVYGRIFLFFAFCALVAAGAAATPLLLLGVVNLLGALWMARSLRMT